MFNGDYLVKFIKGSEEWKVPSRYFTIKTYSFTDNVQDIDSYVDMLGALQRNALEHTRPTLEWEIPKMSELRLRIFFDMLERFYINDNERKLTIECYNLQSGRYEIREFYLAASTKLTACDINNGELRMEPVSIVFTAY